MKISFTDILPGGIRRIIKDSTWSTPAGVIFHKPPQAEISIWLEDDITVKLQGELRTEVESPCSRCGRSTIAALAEKFYYTFRLEKSKEYLIEDLECSDEDIETVYLDKPEIALDEILLEQLILAIPEKLLCSEGCKGICQTCGAMLNSEECSCNEQHADSPFAVLKRLKK